MSGVWNSGRWNSGWWNGEPSASGALSGIPAPAPLAAPGQQSTRRPDRGVLDAAIERVWAHLPEVYRAQDEQLGSPLKTWLGLIVDQITPIDQLLDLGPELVDPDVTPTSWLAWLGQIIGVPLDPATAITAQRARLNDPAKHLHGSAAAIAARVRPLLVGTQTVQVVPRWRDNRWVLSVQTIEAETPLTGEPIATWDELAAVFPCWDDLEELTEDDAHAVDRVRVDIVHAALPEVPAGCRIGHAFIAA